MRRTCRHLAQEGGRAEGGLRAARREHRLGSDVRSGALDQITRCISPPDTQTNRYSAPKSSMAARLLLKLSFFIQMKI